MRRTVSTPEHVGFLDGLEQCIHGIRWPVDEAGMFHLQCHRALLDGGYNVTMEVLMSGSRRVDLVVAHRGLVAAMEMERDAVPERTISKFRDLPPSVLRVAVLRQWPYRAPEVKNADRVVCLTSSLRMVRWLVNGDAILEEEALAEGQQPVRPFHGQVAVDRAHEAGQARRLILGERRGPRSAGSSASAPSLLRRVK